jgi:hypothetical protein
MIGIFLNIDLTSVKRGAVFAMLQINFKCLALVIFVKGLIMLAITRTVVRSKKIFV